MKKVTLFILLIALGFGGAMLFDSLKVKPEVEGEKTANFKLPIVRVALVADSENENDLLQKALEQAQGKGVNFTIGLGDWSQVGTISELEAAKRVFEQSKIPYFLVPGDHDLWDSRNKGSEALENFRQVFGSPTREFIKDKIHFVLLDDSDIYTGISKEDWELLEKTTNAPQESKLTFVFTHKTPFHPESSHVLGEETPVVKQQAENLVQLFESRKIDGLFTGDLHFFARFNSPGGSVKITTVGAASAERNFQGSRFAVLTVWNDYSWDVEDVEIR